MYICKECGFKSSISATRCKSCGAINSFEETYEEKQDNSGKPKATTVLPKKFNPKDSKALSVKRLQFKTESLNTLFWGGLFVGSVNFLSAEPWAGKSTILWQLIDLLEDDIRILYYSGEENEQQVWSRLERLHWKNSPLLDKIDLYYGKDISVLLWLIEQGEVDIVVLDSINSLAGESYTRQAEYMAEVTGALKRKKITGFIIGHINKSWEISWKKTLEHEVDAVFMLGGQGWREDNIRILKVLKQRFGETNNIAVLEMWERGFRVIDNTEAFKVFVTESPDISGSVFCPILEGNQLFLLEIQSLLVDPLYSYPQKVINGWQKVKADTVLAILSKHTKIAEFQQQDVIINVIAPNNFSQLSISFAVAMSLLSSQTGINLKKYIFIWEIGLWWEIRSVAHQEEIIRRLKNLGYNENQIVTRKNFLDIKACYKFFANNNK